jgi:hypothetical protein
MMINGVFCHETGCPNARKTYLPDEDRWVHFVECQICGDEIEAGEICDHEEYYCDADEGE